ncbi:MAG: hypothetical protein JO011_08965 [Ktedonobacteraceae bacterium]|nr:hypothetical protein [Ktedonobacteraceae bacterium]MBV9711030.1 hypothetical protein [Ktedonobacteraceae bacterium]
MDSVVLILTALQTASVTGNLLLKNDIVKDAYVSLRDRIQQKFAGKPGAELALSEYEADPQTWEVPLKKALVQVRADYDMQIVGAAQRIMELIQSQQSSVGKHNIQISGNGQGFAQGDYQSIIINFDDEQNEK